MTPFKAAQEKTPFTVAPVQTQLTPAMDGIPCLVAMAVTISQRVTVVMSFGLETVRRALQLVTRQSQSMAQVMTLRISPS